MPSLPPASSFPPGYLEEYSGNTLVGIASLFIGLNTIFVSIRFYARRQTTASVGWDDFIVPLAWFANCGLCILGITMVHDAGVGHHFAYVEVKNPSQIASWAKSLYALEWLYLPSVALPKISILALYLRIFTNSTVRITCYVTITVLVANWIAFLLASTFQCSPIAYQWNKTIPGGKCFNVSALYKASSAPNIVTDVLMMVLPIPTIWQLQASKIRKVGLLFVFLTGSVGIVASCARMANFFQNDAFTDNTWVSVTLVGWSIVEPGMYLIAACLLTFRPLFQKLPMKWLTSRLSGGSSSYNPHTHTANTAAGGGTVVPLASLRPTSRSGFAELRDPPPDHAPKDQPPFARPPSPAALLKMDAFEAREDAKRKDGNEGVDGGGGIRVVN